MFLEHTCECAWKRDSGTRNSPLGSLSSLSSFSLSVLAYTYVPAPSTSLLLILGRRGSFEMEVVPAGKPQSSFRSHHFRLLSLLLNNLGRYNKRIGIYMEFSLAKMRLKDAATIMNNEARCLPFFDCHSQRRERRKKGEKEREKVEQEIEVVGEKTKASVWVDLCKRPFNCKKTPAITKNKKYGLGLFFFFLIMPLLFQGSNLRRN